MYLETYRVLHAVGLAQDLKRTGDIEQEQAWGDYDEHRYPAQFITTHGRARAANQYFLVNAELSGSHRCLDFMTLPPHIIATCSILSAWIQFRLQARVMLPQAPPRPSRFLRTEHPEPVQFLL